MSVRFQFDGKNEESQAWAAQHGAAYVTRVSAETREALRALITASIRDGIPPGEAARLIRDMVGLTARDAGAVMRYRLSLIQQGVLNDASVAREIRKYAQRLIAQRATTIARTEIMGALNSGALEAARQAIAQGLLDPDQAVKRWLISKDEITRACPVCLPLHGVEVPIESLFPGTGVLAPPAHPRCRCSFSVLPRGTKAGAAPATTGAPGAPVPPQPPEASPDYYIARGYNEDDAREVATRVAALKRQNVTVKGLDITAKFWRVNVPMIRERIDVVKTALLEMESAVNALGVNKGKRRITLNFGVHPSSGQVPYAYAHGSTDVFIDIRSRAWRDRQTLERMLLKDATSGFHPSPDVGTVMIHEIGHARQMQDVMGARIRMWGFKAGPDGFATWIEADAANGGVFHVGQRRYDPVTKLWTRDPTPEYRSIYLEFADPEAVARRVSVYAAKNPHEFVAETWTGLIKGIKYDVQVMRLYEMLGGPKYVAPKAARVATAVVKPVVPKPAIPPPPPPRPLPPPPGPAPAPGPVSGLLPKGAKPVGDPIPVGDKGREILEVIELRKQGLSYQAIDRKYGKPTSAAGAWSIRILKRYGGGRL